MAYQPLFVIKSIFLYKQFYFKQLSLAYVHCLNVKNSPISNKDSFYMLMIKF